MRTMLCLLFKSGVEKKFKVAKWEVKRTGVKLAEISWATEGTTKPVWADIAEIACVWVEEH